MRYPLAPLEVLLGGTTSRQLAERVGVRPDSVRHARRRGLTEDAADRWAVACGLHPSEVWPEWFQTLGYLDVGYNSNRSKNNAKNARETEDGQKNVEDGADAVAVCVNAVVRAVERRLKAAGAVVELRQLRGLSLSERALLAERETAETVACASGSPQASRTMVAA